MCVCVYVCCAYALVSLYALTHAHAHERTCTHPYHTKPESGPLVMRPPWGNSKSLNEHTWTRSQCEHIHIHHAHAHERPHWARTGTLEMRSRPMREFEISERAHTHTHTHTRTRTHTYTQHTWACKRAHTPPSQNWDTLKMRSPPMRELNTHIHIHPAHANEHVPHWARTGTRSKFDRGRCENSKSLSATIHLQTRLCKESKDNLETWSKTTMYECACVLACARACVRTAARFHTGKCMKKSNMLLLLSFRCTQTFYHVRVCFHVFVSAHVPITSSMRGLFPLVLYYILCLCTSECKILVAYLLFPFAPSSNSLLSPHSQCGSLVLSRVFLNEHVHARQTEVCFCRQLRHRLSLPLRQMHHCYSPQLIYAIDRVLFELVPNEIIEILISVRCNRTLKNAHEHIHPQAYTNTRTHTKMLTCTLAHRKKLTII